jgi:MoxR-like ATPase
MDLGELRDRSASVLDEVERAVVGKRETLELVLLALLSDGHVLIEDYPGLAKTLIARSFAQATSMSFARIQFTPDLMPGDVTGSSIFNQREADFEFRPGPIFTNLLLADEINRAPPKTQAALLEAMQERQVTIEGETHPLERPFVVLATQNPIEYEGTYPLPEAQLDRFLLRVSFGYPATEEEWAVLRRRMDRRREDAHLDPVVDGATLLAMQAALEDVVVEDSIGRYMVELASATRAHPQVLVGASPRGSLALLLLARARAAMAGRDYVIPEDVKQVALPALAHRITLRPEMWLQRIDPGRVVADVFAQTPVPATGALPTYAGADPSPVAPSRAAQPRPGGHAAESGTPDPYESRTPDPYRYTAPPRGDR